MKVSFNNKKKFFKIGFTLIELLVVMAIIGILTSILYVNFSDSKKLAKNNSLYLSLKEIKVPLALYKSKHNRYPSDINQLVPDFIVSLPDPGRYESGCVFSYVTDSNGTYYKYTAKNCYIADSVANGVKSDDEMARYPDGCSRNVSNPSFYKSLAIYSKGGECAD